MLASFVPVSSGFLVPVPASLQGAAKPLLSLTPRPFVPTLDTASLPFAPTLDTASLLALNGEALNQDPSAAETFDAIVGLVPLLLLGAVVFGGFRKLWDLFSSEF